MTECEEGTSVLWYQLFGFVHPTALAGRETAAFCALHHRYGRTIAIIRRILPLPSNHRPPQSDQPCETAIECDTGGCGRRPDRSDRSRRPPRHAGAVRKAPCEGVSLRAPARAG